MKKLLVILFSLLLLCGCSTTKEDEDDNTIVVSATIEPHATILEAAKDLLKEKGYELEIEVLDNYYIFNKALDNGDVDANYFQHTIFFGNEVAEYGYDIVNAAGIHIEPFGFYSNKYDDISELPDGAKVVISNSVADHGRLLKVLENNGLITLDPDKEVVDITIDDIVDNPKGLIFEEVSPEMLTTTLSSSDVDLVAINGNYALAAGLNPLNDALIIESAEDNPYVNIIACRREDKDSDKIKALVEVLTSDEIKDFINEKYQGAVVPVSE